MNDTKKYLKNIKRLFPIYGKKEKEFLHGIQQQINNIDDCHYDNLVEELGEPTDIISSYYQQIDESYLMKKLNIKKIIKFACILITIFVLLTCLWRVYVLNKAYEEFQRQNFEWVETIEEVD